MPEQTAKIVHPTLLHDSKPFVTTIRYVGRQEILQLIHDAEKVRAPFVVLDPRTNQPYLLNGRPIIEWGSVYSDESAFASLVRIIVGWENLVLDGKEIPFAPENVGNLVDERLDIDVEVDGQKVRRSWSVHLQTIASQRETFVPDPTGTSSDAP